MITPIVDHNLRTFAWLETHGDCKHVIWKSEWDVVQESPLTLRHSILCQDCGAYGRIEDGEWRGL